MTAEEIRLQESRNHSKHWKRWGPYLSEHAWGTVREDYSPYGNPWEYFPHDQARARVYRWNEDGIAGISDRHQLICFALALWNERDPILKERLFGLSAEGPRVFGPSSVSPCLTKAHAGHQRGADNGPLAITFLSCQFFVHGYQPCRDRVAHQVSALRTLSFR